MPIWRFENACQVPSPLFSDPGIIVQTAPSSPQVLTVKNVQGSLYGISKYICIFDLKNVLFFFLGPKSSLYPSREGVEGVLGAEAADGVDACIREVRRQIGVGADWIKVCVCMCAFEQGVVSTIWDTMRVFFFEKIK